MVAARAMSMTPSELMSPAAVRAKPSQDRSMASSGVKNIPLDTLLAMAVVAAKDAGQAGRPHNTYTRPWRESAATSPTRMSLNPSPSTSPPPHAAPKEVPDIDPEVRLKAALPFALEMGMVPCPMYAASGAPPSTTYTLSWPLLNTAMSSAPSPFTSPTFTRLALPLSTSYRACVRLLVGVAEPPMAGKEHSTTRAGGTVSSSPATPVLPFAQNDPATAVAPKSAPASLPVT